MDDESFIRELQELFRNPSSSFEDWQYAYRKTVYKIGLEILARFPESVIGAPPGAKPAPPPPPTANDFSAKAVGPGGIVWQIDGKSGGIGGHPPGGAGGHPSGGLGGHPSVICKYSCLISDLPPPA